MVVDLETTTPLKDFRFQLAEHRKCMEMLRSSFTQILFDWYEEYTP